MWARASLAAAVVAGLLTFAPAVVAGPADDAARQLAGDIEQRADKTSFADLERFGEQASRSRGRELLRRLEHVSTILLNQSEFARFEHWNGLLGARARALGDHRYQVMSETNELMSRFANGDTSVRSQLERIADTEPDLVARAHATSYAAQLLAEDGEIGAALKRLFAAKDLVPSDDADADVAKSEVWGTIGIALMQLDDLEGAARAFAKSDFELADRNYPRPDFDDVYNMAHLAVQLGDASLARDLAADPPSAGVAVGPSPSRRLGRQPLRHGRRQLRRAARGLGLPRRARPEPGGSRVSRPAAADRPRRRRSAARRPESGARRPAAVADP